MKRICRVLLAFLAAAATLLGAFRYDCRADTYNGVICMWIGGNILPITSETMPFVDGDQYYIPASVFSRYLGCTVRDSNTNNTLSIKYGGRAIFFRHDIDYVLDDQGQFYQNHIIKRNGVWYVPAMFTAKRLGLYGNVFPAFTPSLVYIDASDSTLSSEDAEWFLLYGQLLADRYIASQKPEAESGSTTSTSTSTASASGTKDEKQKVKYTVYLAFRDFPNDDSDAVLTELDKLDVKATFAVSAESVGRSTEELLRRAAVGGHAVILGAGDGFYRSASAAAEEVAAASDAVASVLYSRPRVVMPADVPGEDGGTALTEKLADAVVEQGARLWTPTASVSDEDALRELEETVRYDDTPIVLAIDGADAARLLTEAVAFFKEDESSAGVDFKVITVLEQPVNALGDMR